MEGKGTSTVFKNFSFNYTDLGKGYHQVDVYADTKVQVEAGYVRNSII